jgi:hypothetical protein
MVIARKLLYFSELHGAPDTKRPAHQLGTDIIEEFSLAVQPCVTVVWAVSKVPLTFSNHLFYPLIGSLQIVVSFVHRTDQGFVFRNHLTGCLVVLAEIFLIIFLHQQVCVQ